MYKPVPLVPKKARKIMPTTLLLVSILLMLAFHLLLPLSSIIPSFWNLLGVAPLVLGVIINLIADRTFHRVNTTVKPFEVSSVLVTDGIYQLTRNPMYLGFVMILVGIAVLMGSLAPFLVIVPFVILMNNVYIAVEERMLAEKFPVEWDEYKNRSKRWL